MLAIICTSDPWVMTLLLLAMAPPISLDFTRQIVNVSWAGGLAVEFAPGAG